MPFPKINPGESQDEFMQRCMADDTMVQEYPNEQQRLAICYLQGKRSAKQLENSYGKESATTTKRPRI